MSRATYAKSTFLCLSCLKTAHTLTCGCPGGQVNLGRKKVAELVSQTQGNRNKILKIFDHPELQHPQWQLVRMQIYLAGFDEAGSIALSWADWRRKLESGKGFEIVHKPFCVGEPIWYERYFIRGSLKFSVTLRS